MVVLYPRVSMTVGRKFLNPLAYYTSQNAVCIVSRRAITYRKMEVVHQAEDPSAPVRSSLAETSPNRGTLATAGSIAADTVMSQLAFLGGKPSRLEGAVGEGEETEDGDADGNGTLDDEEPVFSMSDKFNAQDTHHLTIANQPDHGPYQASQRWEPQSDQKRSWPSCFQCRKWTCASQSPCGCRTWRSCKEHQDKTALL